MGQQLEASIIIPVLNEGERLRSAVEAVLRQDCRGAFEVVVVDGGSDDGCCEPLRRDPRVRVLDAPASTAGAARDLGARAARGRILVFTDADCLPQPGWLQGLLDACDRHPEWAAVGGGLRHRWSGTPGVFEDLDTRAHYRGLITSNVAYRPGPFWQVGGFDPVLRCAEDWDLVWRVQEAGHQVGHEPDAVVVHAPSEDETYPRFLRKQAWYARHDMPALLGHVLGRRSPPGSGRGRAGAASVLRSAVLDAGAVALLASVVFAPVGAALLLAWAAWRTVHTSYLLPEARSRAPLLFAHYVAKSALRGVGTWVGLAEYLWAERRTVPRGTPWPRAELPSAVRAPKALEPEVEAEAAEAEPLQRAAPPT